MIGKHQGPVHLPVSGGGENAVLFSPHLSVPQSAYNGSRLAIPCPGTGPIRSRSSSPSQHWASKPTSSSHCRKRRRGAAPSCQTVKEEVVMSTAAAAVTVFSTPPSATAQSPRLTVDPPMLSPLPPVHVSHKLKFFSRTVLLHPSPELMEKVREVEENYEAAVRQFYSTPQLLLTPLNVFSTPQLLLMPLRAFSTPQLLLTPLRVFSTPQLLLMPLRVSVTPQLLLLNSSMLLEVSLKLQLQSPLMVALTPQPLLQLQMVLELTEAEGTGASHFTDYLKVYLDWKLPALRRLSISHQWLFQTWLSSS
ncbi:hypothetical protein ILYODFUR_012046 [Ilyodon furcidens]|uniref:Uncharacterized protein n=1 Tax=Ilyodon furcidens TaxID=33524 RepID=A0ABV0V365_9TELE